MRYYSPPKAEIIFAAKAGFLSRSIWKKFFSKNQRSWSNQSWNQFVDRGIFRVYGRNKDRSILVLNKRSDLVRSIVLDEISSPPNPYQIVHDELVMEFVLGLEKEGRLTSYFFEPEIKRNPSLFGLQGSSKYPDAIIKRGPTTFALEIELSRKSPKKYEKALWSYREMDSIDEIIYLAGSKRIRNYIQSIAKGMAFPVDEKPIQISLLNVS